MLTHSWVYSSFSKFKDTVVLIKGRLLCCTSFSNEKENAETKDETNADAIWELSQRGSQCLVSLMEKCINYDYSNANMNCFILYLFFFQVFQQCIKAQFYTQGSFTFRDLQWWRLSSPQSTSSLKNKHPQARRAGPESVWEGVRSLRLCGMHCPNASCHSANLFRKILSCH